MRLTAKQFTTMVGMLALLMSASVVQAQSYNIDPGHTYPSFEADHLGLSFWRGKFTKTTGKVVLDRGSSAGGSIDITIDASTIDFGHAKMNENARGKDMFNVEQFPTVTYKSRALKFDGEKLVAVEGDMTLLGVTKPMPLKVTHFKCAMHAMLKREVCGVDASARFDRSDYGLSYGVPRFSPEVKLQIQAEAIRAD
jgi:polyisoprenoid-binding protein YceI